MRVPVTDDETGAKGTGQRRAAQLGGPAEERAVHGRFAHEKQRVVRWLPLLSGTRGPAWVRGGGVVEDDSDRDTAGFRLVLFFTFRGGACCQLDIVVAIAIPTNP